MIENATMQELSVKEEEILSSDRSVTEKIDDLQSAIAAQPPVECPLIHRFTPGLYIREIFMPAGSLIVSKIHKTEHPYFILKGKVVVFTEADGEVVLSAPYTGITRAGTRRVLLVQEDCIWATAHPVRDGETLEEIEDRIIEKHELPAKIENV